MSALLHLLCDLLPMLQIGLDLHLFPFSLLLLFLHFLFVFYVSLTVTSATLCEKLLVVEWIGLALSLRFAFALLLHSVIG